MAMSPSFRLGTNSLPMRVASKPDSTTATAAPVNTTGVLRITLSSSGAYQRLAARMMAFSFSATLSPINSATAAGMKVIDSSMAPSRAITTVRAIGVNMRPSTPVSAKMGRYTTMMISWPYSKGRRASCDAANTS